MPNHPYKAMVGLSAYICYKRLFVIDKGTMMKKSLVPNVGIAAKDREAIAKGLAYLLADSYVLYLKTHGFHWNVTGPMFNTLHDMFMNQYTEQWAALDMIAERIRSLGYAAPASYAAFVELTSITEETGVPKATDMIQQLVEAQEAVARTARQLMPVAAKAGDEPTADLLTQRLQVHEKTAWMLRSLLQEHADALPELSAKKRVKPTSP